MDFFLAIPLAIAFFIVQFFSVVSGGAGLLERPLLIFSGLPPQVAVGSARIAHLGTRLIALLEFQKHEKIDWRLAALLFFPSIVGGVLGAQFVVSISGNTLQKLIGLLVLAIGVFLWLKSHVGIRSAPTPGDLPTHATGFGGIVGSSALASVTGGESILVSFVLMAVYKKTYLAAAALRRVVNYGSAFASATVFLIHGLVDWKIVFLILIAGGLGNYFGVRYGIRKGEEWVRKITLTLIFLTGAYLLVF